MLREMKDEDIFMIDTSAGNDRVMKPLLLLPASALKDPSSVARSFRVNSLS
jgi:hypothetical protein